jgi:hypothetical protein
LKRKKKIEEAEEKKLRKKQKKAQKLQAPHFTEFVKANHHALESGKCHKNLLTFEGVVKLLSQGGKP